MGYCVSDIISKCGVGIVIYQITYAKSDADFSKDLADEEAAESDALESYDKQTQENKIEKTTKDQDVKYKTQAFKALDAEIADLHRR